MYVCMYVLWTWISLLCKWKGQDLTLRIRLVDIFTNTQINMIGPFDWQCPGDGGDICHCTFCGEILPIFLPGKEFVCKILQFSVYKHSRFTCVLHWFCFWQCLWRNLILVLEEHFPEMKSLTKHQSLAHSHKSQGCVRHSANWTWKNIITQLIPDVGKYLYLTCSSYHHQS